MIVVLTWALHKVSVRFLDSAGAITGDVPGAGNNISTIVSTSCAVADSSMPGTNAVGLFGYAADGSNVKYDTASTSTVVSRTDNNTHADATSVIVSSDNYAGRTRDITSARIVCDGEDYGNAIDVSCSYKLDFKLLYIIDFLLCFILSSLFIYLDSLTIEKSGLKILMFLQPPNDPVAKARKRFYKSRYENVICAILILHSNYYFC